jgi:two-component system chemotaxis sensor kinase CheA
MAIELSAERAGLIGSAIISGKAVDIVDVGHFLTLAFADLFDAAQDSVANGKHALLVDDSPFFRNLIAPLLKAANWQVTTAADGAEALKLRDSGQTFDIIISDIEMPNVDGLTLAGAVRSDERWQETPMIALSSHANADDINAGREAGFNEYLAKSDQTHLPENLARAIAAVTQDDATNWRRAS